MKLHEMPKSPNRRKRRVGRGESSGWGKTAGKGNKGAKARSGYRVSPVTSGVPWYRKLPIRGFSNFRFRRNRPHVALKRLLPFIERGISEFDVEILIEKGVVRGGTKEIKIIGNEELPAAITITAEQFSEGAAAAIARAGGRMILIGENIKVSEVGMV
ncbi:MAG: 50S ribosomal protein L15 [Puniceicoccales bacterium]|jgi:large subunit ribosomal protein L15|nr:50S ribosomal protein L15 [Puniceicoccales bacterium]